MTAILERTNHFLKQLRMFLSRLQNAGLGDESLTKLLTELEMTITNFERYVESFSLSRETNGNSIDIILRGSDDFYAAADDWTPESASQHREIDSAPKLNGNRTTEVEECDYENEDEALDDTEGLRLFAVAENLSRLRCHFCNKGFNRDSRLRQHIRIKHEGAFG